MTVPRPSRRRVACYLARAATAVSAVMLVLGVAAPLLSGHVALAATNAGTLQVLTPSATGGGAALNSGGSATAFVLSPPPSASCTGDSVAGYRSQSYIVPASVDPGTLAFDSNGPTPSATGANLRQPLVDSNGTPWVQQTVGLGDGLIVGLATTTFDFAAYGPGADQLIPPGTYNLGIACTGPTPSQLDKFWNVQFTFSSTPSDSPGGITWVVVAATTTTTTTSTTSTTVASSSTTSTTSTTPRSTTTSSTTSSTTSTSTTLVASSGTTSGRSGTSSSQLASTGWSSSWFVVWAILLIAFGRMAVLLGRSPRVRPPLRS